MFCLLNRTNFNKLLDNNIRDSLKRVTICAKLYAKTDSLQRTYSGLCPTGEHHHPYYRTLRCFNVLPGVFDISALTCTYLGAGRTIVWAEHMINDMSIDLSHFWSQLMPLFMTHSTQKIA